MSRTHGKSSTKEYNTWLHIKKRCFDHNCPQYSNYGGRGITVCAEWATSFDAFLKYIGTAPSPSHSIDRYPDNNGSYEPGNVRWATPREQANNMRVNRLITYDGRTETLAEWARISSINHSTISDRLASKTPLDIALSARPGTSFQNGKHRLITIDGETLSIAEWARKAGIKRVTVQARLRRGLSMRDALRPITR